MLKYTIGLGLCLWIGLGAPGEAPAQHPAVLGPKLQERLGQPVPAEGIAVGITLRQDDLAPRGSSRRAAVLDRQQRVLDALPAGSFRQKRRYRSLSGMSGWANAQAIEALRRHPEVSTVYLDGVVRKTLTQGAGLVGATSAHALGFTAAGVKVAVLDTGIDSDHPDLSGDLAGQHCFCSGCCVGGVSEASSAEDDEGHGTNVAGIVSSAGVVAPLGVAPDAGIVAVKVLNSSGNGSFSDIDAALDWVLTESAVPGGPVEGVRVVNMSLGDSGQYNNVTASPCSGTNTASAIRLLDDAGIAVFAASGNDGHDNGISFPACVDRAISVGGVYDAVLGSVGWCGNAACSIILCTDNPTAADTFVCHSNSDEILDVLAPDWRTTTSAMGGGTSAFGGTSAASPYAAAEAALLFGAIPALTPAQVRNLLKTHGPAVVNPDNGLSFTRSDVGAALAAIAPGTCGNGFVEAGEACDDGNNLDGDCCSAACAADADGSPCDDGVICTASGSCSAGVCADSDICPAGAVCDTAANTCVALPKVYDFSSGAGVDRFAYGTYTDSWSQDLEQKRGTACPEVCKEVSSVQADAYARLAASDATGGDADPGRYHNPDEGAGDETTLIVEFNITEDPATVTQLDVLWEGYADTGDHMELYVWDYVAGNWGNGKGSSGENAFMDDGARDGQDLLLSGSITTNLTRFISPAGQITLLIYSDVASEDSFHDYVSVSVSELPPACFLDAECGDLNACTDDLCTAGSCQNPPNTDPCEDGDACTTGDTCAGGSCQGGPALVCNNGLFCDGAETCDPGTGCVGGTPPPLDDGVGCTVDSCDDVADAIIHQPDHGSCADGLFCNGAETCDVALDCQPASGPCAGSEVCDELADMCLADSDGDGLLDVYETDTGVFVSPTDAGTDPFLADTDGDGFDDGVEVAAGTDPVNPASFPLTIPVLPVSGLVILAGLLAGAGAWEARRRGQA